MLKVRYIKFAEGIAAGKTNQQAAIDAGYEERSAHTTATRLMQNAEILARIDEEKEMLARLAGITRNWLIDQYALIATADPRELIDSRRACCRHCWGIGFAYQWTPYEYEREVRNAMLAKKPEDRVAPAADGGFGYTTQREPNAHCPECHGDGSMIPIVKDTRKLSKGARALYAGLKVTKDGVEVKMHDQEAARSFLADYLGLKRTKVEMSGPDGGAIPIVAVDLKDEQLAAIAALALPTST